MALPFYNEADQAIYEGGQHFIPQERFRLNYTPPEIMGQNTNAGITAAGVANPYKWPWPIPTGDGGAGDVSGTQVTYKRPLGLSPGALSGGLDEAKLPGFGNWAKRTLGDVQDAYSKLPTPSNLLMKGIRRWRENRATAAAAEKAAAEKAAAEAAATAHVARATSTPGYGSAPGGQGFDAGTGRTTTSGYSGRTGQKEMMAQGGRIGYSNGGSYKDWLSSKGYDDMMKGMSDDEIIKLYDSVKGTWSKAQGGRIGYATRGFVEDVNVEGPGFDENIEMASAEGIPFMWEEFLAAKELDPELTYENFLDAIDKSPSDFFGAQGGIVGLL